MPVRAFLLAGLSLGLMGFCEGVTTDPTRGGLMGGVCGIQTGAYQRRIETRRRELDHLERANQGLQARLDRARRQERVVTTDLDSRRARVRVLGQRVATVERRVAALAGDRAELAGLEREIDRLRRTWRQLAERDERRADVADALRDGQRRAREEARLERSRLREAEDRARALEERLRRLRASTP